MIDVFFSFDFLKNKILIWRQTALGNWCVPRQLRFEAHLNAQFEFKSLELQA